MQLPQTKDSFNYACAEIQKADGTSHPLLKLSLLNFVKLRLESEVQFGEHGVSVSAAFFIFKVIVVEYTNNVFSEGVTCTVNHAFVTMIKYISYETISSRAEVCVSGLVEVTYMQAIGTRFVSGSTFPSKVNCPAVFIGVIIIFVAAHIFAGENEIRSEVIVYANVPYFFVHVIAIRSSIRRIGFIISCISINSTHVSFNTCNIETVAAIFNIPVSVMAIIARICAFSSQTKYFYFVAIGNFNTIDVGIEYVTGEENFIPTASLYIQTANTAVYISTVEIKSIIAFFVAEVLFVLEHSSVSPVFVNFAGYPQTGTKSHFVAVAVAVNIFVGSTNLTGDFYVVSFFLEVSNANAEAVEFVSKFSS